MDGPGAELRAVGGTPTPPVAALCSGHTSGGPGVPTFITRKKARVPKMVNRGWYHSNHRFWGSGSAGQGGDEFRVIRAQELLSNSVSRCSFMDSWGRGGAEAAPGSRAAVPAPPHCLARPPTPSAASHQGGGTWEPCGTLQVHRPPPFWVSWS